jgi:hypothetical protein
MLLTNIALVGLFLYVLWRDRSYHFKMKDLERKLVEIYESSAYCSVAAWHFTPPSTRAEDKPSANQTPPLTLLDRHAFFLCLMFIACRICETFFCHRPHLQRIGELTHIPRKIVVKMNIFLSHSFPVVNISLHSLLLVIAVCAWWGWIDRARNLAIAMKIIILFWLSLPLSLGVWNSYTILSYLPRSFDQLLVKLREKAFWWWVVSKLFAIDDLYHFIQAALSLFYSAIYTLPFLYIFFYKEISFDLSSDAMNIFIANMIAQSSLSWIWVNLLIICTLGSPPIIKQSFLSSIIRRLTSNTMIIVFSLLQIVNLLLCCFRIFYFLFLTWSCKTLLSHIAIMLLLVNYACAAYGGLSFFGILINKDKLSSEEKSSFVEKLAIKYQELVDKTSPSGSDDPSATFTAVPIVNAEETFDEILQSCGMISCFLTDDDLKEYIDSTASAPATEANNEDFFVVFKRVFHQTTFRYFSSIFTPSEDEEPQEEQRR